MRSQVHQHLELEKYDLFHTIVTLIQAEFVTMEVNFKILLEIGIGTVFEDVERDCWNTFGGQEREMSKETAEAEAKLREDLNPYMKSHDEIFRQIYDQVKEVKASEEINETPVIPKFEDEDLHTFKSLPDGGPDTFESWRKRKRSDG